MTDQPKELNQEAPPSLAETLAAAETALSNAKATQERSQKALEEAEWKRSQVAAEAIMGNTAAAKLLKAANQDRANAEQALDDATLAIKISTGRVAAANRAITEATAGEVLKRANEIGAERISDWENFSLHIGEAWKIFAKLEDSKNDLLDVYRELRRLSVHGAMYIGLAEKITSHSGGDLQKVMQIISGGMPQQIRGQLENIHAAYGIYWNDPVDIEKEFWARHREL